MVANIFYVSEGMTSLTSPGDSVADDTLCPACTGITNILHRKSMSVGQEAKGADYARHLSFAPPGSCFIILHTILCLRHMTCKDYMKKSFVYS